jgi:hypothetical protein
MRSRVVHAYDGGIQDGDWRRRMRLLIFISFTGSGHTYSVSTTAATTTPSGRADTVGRKRSWVRRKFGEVSPTMRALRNSSLRKGSHSEA